jgi:hypothetical protein
MNNIWYNKIQPPHITLKNEIGLMVGVLSFGLLAPFIITYRQPPEVRIFFIICIIPDLFCRI